ncbi:MAG: hypothetical protein VYB35_07745 [Verrucomicrobiota bacterium]|nr:hypothetical protein [Verrucomicrobiota bacterium]|tara:strand:- start:1061 stop:1327 length:267 start_codon:yes stop_codon:yes gene_type:complete
MTTFIVVSGAILVLISAFILLPAIFSFVSSLVLWLVVVPVFGTVLGLFFSYVIKRVILPKSSPHRDSATITIGSLVVGWLIVLLSLFG